MNIFDINKNKPVIGWWSGGVTSAVTCKLCIDWFGVDSVRIIFQDTHNEDDDIFRFKEECQNWYGREIETITNPNYSCIQEVWYKFLSLNVATGAICSNQLKRVVREEFEKVNNYSFQAFGFDIKETHRALGMRLNNPKAKPIFPLINELLSKKDTIKYIQKANNLFHPLRLPNCYYRGLHNNNCYKTGCIQGGIGYWKWFDKNEPWKVDAMAKVEHDLTDLKGEPVTILKDQSKGGGLVFLRSHPNYPNIKDLSMMKGRPVLPLLECNGFCGMNDIEINKTVYELNYK
jgi:hypothetical protein